MPDILTRTTVDRLIEQLRRLAPISSDVQRDLSFADAVMAASKGQLRQQAPREYEAWADPENPQRIRIPWNYLADVAQRDLQATGAGSAGAYLVDEQVRPFALPLTGSGAGQAGATFVLNATRNQKIPAMGTTPSFQWLANESASLSFDPMTLTAAAVSPNVGGIAVRVSRFITQQTNIQSLLNQLLIQTANDAIDRGAFNGSGASGEPLGLLQNANVVNTSGTTLNVSGLSSMEELAVQNGANDANLTWIAATDTRRKLRPREISTGSGSIWPDATLLGHRAIVTDKMPSSTLLVGDFSNLVIVLFGPGAEVLVDPFSAFNTGRITFQLRLSIGILCSYPAAFRKSTSIT